MARDHLPGTEEGGKGLIFADLMYTFGLHFINFYQIITQVLTTKLSHYNQSGFIIAFSFVDRNNRGEDPTTSGTQEGAQLVCGR